MSDLAKQIATLSLEKRALLLQKMQEKMVVQQLQQRQSGNTQQQILPQKRNPDMCALSFAQERLWFLHQWEPLSPWYNMPLALRLYGQLDVSALERSLAAVVQRHEVLRTTFEQRSARTVQVIASTLPIQMPVIDLGGLTFAQRNELVTHLARTEAQNLFDLAQGPLLRVCLLRLLAPQEHVLLLTLHHIITDGWSMGILAHEITTLYQAHVNGEPSPLPELPLQYADYALWQRNWLQGEALEAQMAYWSKQLTNLAPLELPTDHPRPTMQSYRGSIQSLYLPEALADQLQRLCREEQVTLFMLLLGTWQVLLARYTQQNDICVGTPIANRRQAELEGLIGFFVNTLVIRTDLGDNPTFVEVLQRVREVCLSAYANQDIPFEKVVEELEPERDLSRSPLFQVLFVLQNVPGEQGVGNFHALSVEPLPVETTTSKFDLTLSVVEMGQGLRCQVEYATDLFEAETIVRMLTHFQTLLKGIVQNRQNHLSELPLFTDAEREQLLVQWNATRTDYPQDLCVHQLFEQQVARTPDAVALIFADEMLTYQTLNQRANQLAHHLQKVGLGPDERVGICMQRSLNMVIAVLGVLKAGGAYVPLDPVLPAERLLWMLEEVQPLIVLTQTQMLSTLALADTPLVNMDTHWSALCNEESLNPAGRGFTPLQVLPESLMYVIYTSGSTGKPKGAMNTHRGLCNRLSWMQHTYQLSSRDRVVQKTPFSFDISVWEIFWPLMTGASLIVAAPGGHQDPSYLQSLVIEQAVTTLHFVPSMLQAFLQESDVQDCESLHQVFCSGEALSSALQTRFFAVFPEWVQLHNLYGPTEASIDVTFWSCQRGDAGRIVPIGRPIANTQIYLLDQNLQPVPVGVSGELYIGGAGLARGYWRRPDLTAEKFIADPFSRQAGMRLYRTGDLARYQADGTLEFLGRVDHQVKLRGYRIELGEIETVLSQHEAIQEGVVLLQEDAVGEKRLVAYLVVRPGQRTTERSLRTYLSDRLPVYMIPTAFVFVDSFPLTPNGKMDRRALPAPLAESQQAEDIGAEEARAPIEELLRSIFCDLLDPRRETREVPLSVGIHQDFFKLGGHSLLATRLIAQVRALFGVEVPLRAVFEAPTVAEFTERVEQVLREAEGMQTPPLAAAAHQREEPIPLSFAQQRLWFLDQLEPQSTAYLVAHAYRFQGNLQVRILEGVMQEVVSRHESLRTTFEERAGQVVQVIHQTSHLILPVVDLQGLLPDHRERETHEQASQEAQHSMHLSTGPLLRTSLLRLDMKEHVLLLTLHHIITDGWSSEVLVRELTSLYQAHVSGYPLSLPPLPIQYADYALWQRNWLQGEVLEAQMAYWRKQLTNLSPLGLPTTHSRPAIQTYRGAVQSLQLPEVLLERLQHFCREAQVTLFMLLLGIWQVLLARYTQQSDISVACPVANRGQAEVEGLIGFFVNTLIMRTDLRGNPTFVEVLQRVREVCLSAYTHQDIPFEKVIEELEPQRDLSRSPLSQVMFVLQDTPQQHYESLPGISIEPLAVPATTSKFDLTLSVSKTVQGLHCALEYSTDLFTVDTIRRMLAHFQTLLEGVVQNPQARLSDLPLLTATEQDQLLVEWNATQTDYPQDLCVHQLFEQQVERAPDGVALVFGDQILTYDLLNRRSNQLARHLQTLGVGPEVLVGVCMERSIEVVVGLLGILKAGGASVPLDPTHPQERLAHLVADAQVTLLLTQEHLHARFLAIDAPILCLDTHWSLIAEQSQENLPWLAEAENLVYVIYTSGSTGRPKGVGVQQEAFLNLLLWYCDDVGITALDRVLLVTALNFDSSQKNIFAPLIMGGTLHMPTLQYYDPTALLQIISLQNITVVNCTPNTFYPLIEGSGEEVLANLPSLRSLLLGGEPLAIQRLWGWITSPFCHTQVFNVYGLTECSDITTSHLVLPSQQSTETAVPIGRPIRNEEVFILDKDLQPIPIGIPGELYIGGTGLARGYLGQAELTAQYFVPHPFVGIRREGVSPTCPGERLYRTGDLARYQPDGSIEYLGRIDNQVKLRGYRIELGEIEGTLRAYPGVQDALVVLRVETEARKYLVAYVVAQARGTVPTVPALQEYLREQLPDYMVPSLFVMLDTLPLSPNGKVDRRALPAPHDLPAPHQATFVGPRTPLEELLAQIWMRVLDRQEQVGIHDNFFELGGHSLLATRVISHMRQVVNRELPLRALFEAPTVARLAQRIEQALRKNEEIVIPPLAPAAVTRPADIPLSFAQQRLWFLDQLEPGGTAYLVPFAVRFTGRLNLRALEKSFQELVCRHEILHTTFEERDGQAVQVLQPAGRHLLPVIDLQALRQEQREAETQRLAREEAQHPCDLARGPLLRTSLLQLSKHEYVLLLTLHHIITDGWSNEVLVRELLTLYQANISGRPSPWPPQPIQYADYTLWQRVWLQGELLDAELSYWRKQLADLSPLYLPTDYPRPAVQTYQGGMEVRLLPEELSSGLVALSQREQVTLFMLLLAAFQVLLARLSQETDVAVGTPIANRTCAELEGVIGFFVNTLVMRTDLSGNPTFVEVLSRVREVCLGAYAHQDIPFEKIVEELHPERFLSHSPLFNVMLVMENFPREQVEKDLAELSIEPLAIQDTASKFDLTLYLRETKQGLSCIVRYNTYLFAAETIRCLLNYWQTLLQGIVYSPQVHIWDVPLLTEGEREHVLAQGTAPTSVASPLLEDLCLHQLFEQQVERTPEAIAVVFEQSALTYRELDMRANQLAHYLHLHATGPEVLVGICLERSLEMMVALLGVLKAGGAYVPLDPELPDARLAFMVQDSQVTLLLTQSHLQGRLATTSLPLCCLDTSESSLTSCPTTRPDSLVQPDNLAYVIYTSGSTGTPKGVLSTHRSVVNVLSSLMTTYPLAGERVLQLASISFDPSVRDIMGPLISGGSTILLPPPEAKDPLAIARKLSTYAITTLLSIVPSMLRELQQVLRETNLTCPSLHTIGTCGETLYLSDVSEVQTLFEENAVVVNQYGPTECTMVSNCYTMSNPSQESLEHIPLGRPIPQRMVYILDAYGDPVPMGIPGELHIGGQNLSRGYLNQPALTAERFIPNLFPVGTTPCVCVGTVPCACPRGGERLYKTGDLARYLPDGNIEFLGRVDQQVKIRGHRVELSEIETVLRQHEAVQACAVLDVGTGVSLPHHALHPNEKPLSAPTHHSVPHGGEKRLVAYIVAKQGNPSALQRALRSYLQERLPAYMLPSAFVLLDALPLTPNGKIDRVAIRRAPMVLAPEIGQDERNRLSEEPRTPIEDLLVGLWSEVLHNRKETCEVPLPVGIHENFFELGGHSLLATRLVARVRVVLGLEIPLRAVFEAPTIATFAKLVEQALQSPLSITPLALVAPPLAAVARPEEIPLSFGQQRLWFLDQLDPDSTAYLSSRALRILGHVHTQALEQSLQELVQRHESLRTTFEIRAGQPIQVIHPLVVGVGGLGRPHSCLGQPLPIIDLHELKPEQRAHETQRLAEQETQSPMNLSTGPLLRASLLRIAEQEHILLLTLHHIITDGWSNAVLLREMTTLYQSKVAGQPSPLPPLPIQYVDYALWQRTFLQDHGSAQMAYWREQLVSVSPLALPTDHPRKARQTYHGAEQSLLLAEEVSAGLKALSRAEHVTLFMLLLAAFQVLLARYSQQQDIAVGTPVANRRLSELEGLIGFLVNTLVIRTDLSGHPSFVELLTRVRKVCLEAYTHQDIPFEKVVEELEPERDLSRSPLFQVMFQLQNAIEARPTLSGVGETHRDRGFPRPSEPYPQEKSLSGPDNHALAGSPEVPIHIQPLALESKTSKFDLTLSITETAPGASPGELHIALEYNTDLFEADTITRLLTNFQTLLTGIVQNPQARIADLPLLTAAELGQLLVEWNATKTDYPQGTLVHQLFEQQVQRTPDTIALVFEDEMLSYAELNRRANQLAHHLQKLGIGPDGLVGIFLPRSLETVVAMLGILKAGGAYVPLDPTYPQERLTWILADSHLSLVLTYHLEDAHQFSHVGASWSKTVCLGTDWVTIATDQESSNLPYHVAPENLAYMIYTSGSTGKPKGTMVTHRNVVNFFTDMDKRFAHSGPCTWLAVTSISFDISVLELLWTLTQGFRLCLQPDDRHVGIGGSLAYHAQRQNENPLSAPAHHAQKELAFSLFYFANDTAGASPAATSSGQKYRLLLEGAKFADAHNFQAVWTPERHFHPFGGLYPNPSVTSAAIAAVTRKVQIRAGSVVLPLHDPVRVAEEWAMVDNLSAGRVGISFATGWLARDFVLAPEQYTERKKILKDRLATVRKLWRGEAIALPDPMGKNVEVKIYPQPLQAELPIWLTSSGNPETFRQAGEMGANLLTHLLGQDLDSLAEKIAIYREAREQQGHSGPGHVTLMLHTFIGTDSAVVREKVHKPFTNYLRSSADLLQSLVESLGYGKDINSLSEDDLNAVLAHGFERYYETSALMGTPHTCLPVIERLKEIGVDEVACLIDFGIDEEEVLASLHALARLKRLSEKKQTDETLSASIKRQGVTHLQCTPSLAQLFLLEPEIGSALGSLQTLLLGGEALPLALAKQLGALMRGEIHNMYGPTETTIWSTTQMADAEAASSPIAIGRPIANTQVHILDPLTLQLQPIGVTGELFIGGHGVVRGYLRQPDMTADKFLPHPFACQPGACIYRTGDLARYRADGTIEYLGRIDHQVKLRGFRIELGEIEATLQRHPAIQACAVLAQEDRPGEKRLIAYVVVRQESAQGTGQGLVGARTGASSAPTASVLRSYLQDHLPAYMIPAAFVSLDTLPLMPNGKVDRRALATKTLLQDTRPTEEEVMVAPRTHIEKALAAIWTDLLHLEQVSISDNFFALGGHSLLAVQLLNRINQQFRTTLSLSTLFQIPTIAQVATLLQTEVKELPNRANSLTQSLCVPIQPTGENPPFFCVHPSPGVVSCFLDLAKHLRHDRPFYGIQAPGLDADGALFSTVEEMAASYIDALSALQPSDTPYFLAGYSFGGLVAFEMARQLQLQGRSVALLALLDSYPVEQDASVGTHAGASPIPLTEKDDAKLIVELAEVLGRYRGTNIGVLYEDVCRLQADEQLAYLLDRLREAEVLPDNTGMSEVRRMLRVSGAHQLCERRYRPKPYAGRITLFRSENAKADPSSWAPFPSEPVEVHSISGDHVSMVAEPYVQSLAVQLQQCLDQAEQEFRKEKQ